MGCVALGGGGQGGDQIPGGERVLIFALHYFDAKTPLVFHILEAVISFGFVSLPKKTASVV